MQNTKAIALGMRLVLGTSLFGSSLAPALALPPPADQPEEIQRTEIITEARSPLDGQPLSAAEYAELQAQLQARRQTPAILNPEVRRIITQLRIRQAIRSVFPFLLR
ncbi:MAG: hypothetical protein HC781_12605 [Leptolyngbyaceae cyanobacterium CSU_1_4]|nr:hypothetical protein [Leptolyngbyaceae cyanobacterium CSU_1_4]